MSDSDSDDSSDSDSVPSMNEKPPVEWTFGEQMMVHVDIADAQVTSNDNRTMKRSEWLSECYETVATKVPRNAPPAVKKDLVERHLRQWLRGHDFLVKNINLPHQWGSFWALYSAISEQIHLNIKAVDSAEKNISVEFWRIEKGGMTKIGFENDVQCYDIELLRQCIEAGFRRYEKSRAWSGILLHSYTWHRQDPKPLTLSSFREGLAFVTGISRKVKAYIYVDQDGRDINEHIADVRKVLQPDGQGFVQPWNSPW